jgi:hypothetical protein
MRWPRRSKVSPRATWLAPIIGSESCGR